MHKVWIIMSKYEQTNRKNMQTSKLDTLHWTTAWFAVLCICTIHKMQSMQSHISILFHPIIRCASQSNTLNSILHCCCIRSDNDAYDCTCDSHGVHSLIHKELRFVFLILCMSWCFFLLPLRRRVPVVPSIFIPSDCLNVMVRFWFGAVAAFSVYHQICLSIIFNEYVNIIVCTFFCRKHSKHSEWNSN